MRIRLPINLLSLTLLSLATVFFVANCAQHSTRTATFGTSNDIVNYGVYSAQKQDAGGMATKLSLNQNNTYSRKKFQSACLLVENKGEWKGDHESIEFHLTEVRKRNDCNSENWEIEKVDRKATRIIRNMTTNSFDMLDQEDDSSAQWVRYVKR